MADAVVVTAVVSPNPGLSDHVLALIQEVVPRVHDEPGCELYAAHRAPDGTVVIIEKWASESALDAHSSGQNLAILAESLDGLLAAPLAVSFLAPLPCGDREKGEI